MRDDDLEIAPAEAAHWADLEALFQSSAHVNACWCIWPCRQRGLFSAGPHNREALRALVASGQSPGLIAFVSGRAAGWCALGPRERYPQYRQANDPDEWAIACIFIVPEARGLGIGRRLIDAAAARAFGLGARAVVGPPHWWQAADDGNAAVIAAFRACGFRGTDAEARMPALRKDRR